MSVRRELDTETRDAAASADDRCVVQMILSDEALPEGSGPSSLGFKAWNLARMASLGFPVPPAFVIGTGWCDASRFLVETHWRPALERLEQRCGLRFGHERHPLLLSVRSGAPVSMPGMMETLLNIGLCASTLPGFIRVTGHPRLAWDAYRRLIAGYGEVVAGIDPAHFEADIDEMRQGTDERELDFSALREIAERHLATYSREAGEPFPQDAHEQLRQAIVAVFASWGSEKARTYRALHGVDDRNGTAVTVQQMVFGNAGGLSGAGVGFTRNPSSGEPRPWVDFLFNAQGEDVVSGRRSALGHEQLASVAPPIWQALVGMAARLENAFGDMQDFEFTVQQGQLHLLQTRSGKRTPLAAARIAIDLLDAGLIDERTVLERTKGLDAHSLVQRTIVAANGASLEPIARAPSAASGVAFGEIALDETQARERRNAGARVILVRRDAETRDITALDLADGLLTSRGARTSHAAVVARQLGKVCLVGCEALQIDEVRREVSLGEQTLSEGALITLDGNEGAIYAGVATYLETVPEVLLARLDEIRRKSLKDMPA
jgi:pyruvate,orthophosphate dikinase